MGLQPLQAVPIDEPAKTLDGTTPGSSYALIGEKSYDLGYAKEFVAFVIVHQNPTGTTPTLDVRIEQSPTGADGTWATLADFTQFTTDKGVKTISVPGPGTSDPKTFARYIRFMAKTGGTTPVYTATITVSPRE